MLTKQIASSTLWQLGSQVTMAALSILTAKFVAIGLTKELAGNYNSAYGYLQLFGILADFGLYAVAVREVARAVPGRGTMHRAPTGQTREDVLGALIVLRVLILTVSLSAALAIAWSVPAWRGTPLPLAITIAALVPLFTLLAGMVRASFQVMYRMHFVFIAEVLQRIVSTGLIAIVIVMGVRQSTSVGVLHWYLWSGGIGAAVLFMTSVWYGNRLLQLRLRFDPVLLKRFFLLAAPYGIAFLCTALYRQFDTTLIALLRPDYEIQNAYYGFVARMMDMAYLIPTFLLNSTLPIVVAREHKGEDTSSLLGKTLLILLLLGTVSLLFALLWTRPLVELLTTRQYLSSPGHPGTDTALALLAVPMFLNGLIQFSFYVLLTKHAWRQLVATLALGVAVSLFLNYKLIPPLGFVGNADTSIIVHTMLTCLLLPQALSVMRVRLPSGGVWRWVLFSVGLGLGLGLGKPFLTGSLMTIIGLGAATVWMGVLFWVMRMRKVFA